MADILEATATPDTVTIDGKSYPLHELTVYDRADLMALDRKARKALLVENLKTAGVSPEDFFQTLQAFDSRRAKELDWIDFVNCVESEPDIFARSLEKSAPGQGKDLVAKLALAGDDILRLKAQITGLSIVTPEATSTAAPADAQQKPEDTRTFGDGAEREANPTTPATWSNQTA